MQNTARKSIRQAAYLCDKHRASLVVISPGSRNAALNMAFARSGLKTVGVPDERVAGFYALGAALQTGRVSVLICTSGSAVLNYAPAVAEAYFQEVPMLILSADRPSHLIGQGEGQCIYQKDVFGKHVKASYQFPDDAESEHGLRESNRIMNEALRLAHDGVPGPVHVNIPFAEPLYDQEMINVEEKFEIIHREKTKAQLIHSELKELKKLWSQHAKRIIVVGQNKKDDRLSKLLERIQSEGKAVVLCESTSNINSANRISNIDRCMCYIEEDSFFSQLYKADLVVSIGGALVSKKIKAFFRKNNPKVHWYLGENNRKPDVFQALSHCIDVDPILVLEEMLELPEQKIASEYVNAWFEMDNRLSKHQLNFESKLPFCDYTVMQFLLRNIPEKSDLHIGNSSPIRYSNLFKLNSSINVYCNRGTSGIDGMSSTAIGAALMSKKTTTIISGDIAFVYDSNAFWSKHVPNSMRIIVINNGGGGIFRIIPGPDTTEELEEYFEMGHKRNMKELAKAFGLMYLSCSDMDGLKSAFQSFYKESDTPKLIEIHTMGDLSAEIQRDYFKKIKEAYEQSDKLADSKRI